ASGEDNPLFVVSDPDNWQALESSIKDVFERVIKTPQPEKLFEVHWIPPEKFSQFATKRNLAIVGILNAEGEINKKVSNMLSAEVKAKVADGSAFVFPKENPWAKNQLLVVLASTSFAEMREKLQDNKDYLYQLFEKKVLAETGAKMFSQLEQTEISEELLENYGWMVRIQHDYIINIERLQDRFVMIRRSLPGRERWLFVHWIEDGDPDIISEKWALNTRDKLTRKFYENDLIDREHTVSEEVDFLNRSALKLEGLWGNDEKVAGGPFRNYTFYDDQSGRIYMIDVAVWFPRGNKEPFLRQLDIIANTFKTADEVRKETEKEVN
ncbi:DUF4837 family protein, partial [candidate division KSB1 bacterium]|nr:DUF4837 family protein [candidate division KSB1 bacterium]